MDLQKQPIKSPPMCSSCESTASRWVLHVDGHAVEQLCDACLDRRYELVDGRPVLKAEEEDQREHDDRPANRRRKHN